ncbi:unnamed protein product [Effrenium voratum]|uniref:FO synthase n=1 Tax=Effrenium voratum TaxID=2562239 RepID=A0AA36HVL3_9DINO|nr:unnamed protein product [Effrenium voratum]CAJ1428597.1 unnamed protein product [Effrenium voratum]
MWFRPTALGRASGALAHVGCALGCAGRALSRANSVVQRSGATVGQVLEKAHSRQELSADDAEVLFRAAGSELGALQQAADALRKEAVGEEVTYVVNRNINFTNVCVKRCGFCAFSRTGRDQEGYFLPLEEVLRRVQEAKELGATEICVQAGLAPNMAPALYEDIARAIKAEHPELHLHAFSPEEVLWGARRNNVPLEDYLARLKAAGVDSLPGTSAEILDDKLRAQVAKGRLSVEEWVAVVSTAHRLGLPTTSTMMFGFCESPRQLANHMVLLREIQKKAEASDVVGFTEFVPLGFVASEAPMWKRAGALQVRPGPTGVEVLKAHAVARLVLNPLLPGGIRNLQVSWVKEGFKMAQLMLTAGANDLGGTLMNESISTAAGAGHGQLAAPKDLRRLAWELGRGCAQRSTSYERLKSFACPGTDWDRIEAETKGALDQVDVARFGSFQELVASPDYRFKGSGNRKGKGPMAGSSRGYSTARAATVSDQSADLSIGDRVVTYSPSFTLVPTYECFNVCSYCNFRKDVTREGADWMSEQQARRKLESLVGTGVEEILVMSGEVHPRARNRAAWVSMAEKVCSTALELGFLPHTNIGPLGRSEMARLKEVNASMGLMLEQTVALAVHDFAPSKEPSMRMAQLRQAGELKVPFTTGLLLGIGETTCQRLEALDALAEVAEEFGHVQEVILQPHSLGSSQKLRDPADVAASLPEVVAAARKRLPPGVRIQVPPNLILHHTRGAEILRECLANGARDLGGISPRDEVNPDFAFPVLEELRKLLTEEGYILQSRLPVYPQHFEWLSERVRRNLR